MLLRASRYSLPRPGVDPSGIPEEGAYAHRDQKLGGKSPSDLLRSLLVQAFWLEVKEQEVVTCVIARCEAT